MYITSVVIYVVYGLTMLFEILKRICKVETCKYTNSITNSVQDQEISILVPLRNEKIYSIVKTLNSIINQEYDLKKLKVYLIIDHDDYDTLQNCMKLINYYRLRGLDISIKIVENCRKIKAHVLNKVIPETKSDLIVIFDADDYIPNDYVSKVVTFLTRYGYVLVGTKVLRYRNTLLGALMLLELLYWYERIQPFLNKLFKITLLSGEGLAFRKSIVQKIPEEFAEDAALSVRLSLDNQLITLIDSVVIETAPKNLKSFIKQRIRWIKGTYLVFKNVLKSRNISTKVKLRIIGYYTMLILMSVLTTVTCILAVYSLTLNDEICRYVTISVLSSLSLINLMDFLRFRNYIFKKLNIRLNTTTLLLSIFYYTLLSLISIYAFLIPLKNWFKTER